MCALSPRASSAAGSQIPPKEGPEARGSLGSSGWIVAWDLGLSFPVKHHSFTARPLRDASALCFLGFSLPGELMPLRCSSLGFSLPGELLLPLSVCVSGNCPF